MKLQTDQTKILGAIKAAKTAYDNRIAAIDAAYLASKEAAKNPIRELVGTAQEAGVPKRQIHLAMGFAQIGSLTSWLQPSAKLGLYVTPVDGNVEATGQALADALSAPDTISFREGLKILYWFEGAEEKKMERSYAGDYEDGRGVYTLNRYTFPKMKPEVQQALLYYKDEIHLSTEEEINDWFEREIVPARYTL